MLTPSTFVDFGPTNQASTLLNKNNMQENMFASLIQFWKFWKYQSQQTKTIFKTLRNSRLPAGSCCVLEVASQFFSLKSSNFPSKAPWQKYETGHGGLATNCWLHQITWVPCLVKTHVCIPCAVTWTSPHLDSFAVHANLRGGVRGGAKTSSRSLYTEYTNI